MRYDIIVNEFGCARPLILLGTQKVIEREIDSAKTINKHGITDRARQTSLYWLHVERNILKAMI